ncbi:hypothetical protein [Paenibacillus xylaniclasticus]|uniref:hypothetical protein n=1 Tax=Paenibacillus xylaniclasticus TaxID=588083 RepID=UPI000FDA3E0A|nr:MULTISPECIES: hypothetical protein [Paenibacillus]GFN31867.1 hypothetical protein PCURB6_21270 [Paenibacillus curdlanolyticus]
MTYRSIDLQTSVARIPEMSVSHSHTMHKPTTDQLFVADQAAREQARARTRNEKLEKTSESAIRDGGAKQSKNNKERKREGDPTHQELSDHIQPAVHPYKGKSIDLSM